MQNHPKFRAWRTRVAAAALMLTVALGALARPAEAQGLSFIRDTEIEDLLSDYAQPIFRAAGLGTGRIAMRIIRHEAFNAFVLDGRNVFIHTGALQVSETPNQVIGVIAHEAGHIANAHLSDLRSKIAADPTRGFLSQFLFVGVMLSQIRGNELVADQAGLRYLNATKQSGRGMIETFERFAQEESFSLQRTPQSLFARTHPFAADRVTQLRSRAQASPFWDTRDPPALQLRHDMMRAKISGYLDRPQIVFNRYPQSDQSLPARYGRAIGTFFGSGVERAIPLVDALIKDQPNNPYFHELKADFLMRSGRAREAVPLLRRSAQLAGANAPLITVRLAQAMVTAEDPNLDETINLARKSLIQDPNPQAYRILANAYYKQNKLPEADLATAEALFLEGDLKQAQIFAKRAQPRLKNGSPNWIRAGDIVNFKISG
ncbi:M48 family metalloprotease [Hyphomicrobium sp. CS1BSMeth3]|uniref:M48 family metalloprotease n=1 Tax=Hyphomicrobium sp. CS1BSMeth3 TaxID=1892844 RepID=UPI0009F883AA|nr:M48 family metalloprotease [Hyphomicrobium sp. CS1BSMeth3]MBN9265919.1 M48 family metallopeptidase [Hyphomicrobium sp.]